MRLPYWHGYADFVLVWEQVNNKHSSDKAYITACRIPVRDPGCHTFNLDSLSVYRNCANEYTTFYFLEIFHLDKTIAVCGHFGC